MKYEPQLATLVKSPPAGDEWLHEIKFDGYRIGCHVRGDRVTLTSRNGKDWTAAFPDIVDAARRLTGGDVMLDGEVAAVLPDGRTSFQAMQQRDGTRATIVYFVFDLLHLDGERLARLPLEERKARLRRLVGAGQRGRIRYSEHVLGSGAPMLKEACRLGLEGIISKRRDQPSVPGRSDTWLKIKCTRRQEFVIGGFTEPQGMRAGIGALLLGYYGGKQLVFAGRVGTGFTHKVAVDLRRQLDAIIRSPPPFTPPPTGRSPAPLTGSSRGSSARSRSRSGPTMASCATLRSRESGSTRSRPRSSVRTHQAQPMQLPKVGETMDQQDGREQYEETTDPKNPPTSVLNPQARRATVTTFLGGIVVFFLIVGAALIYWNATTRRIDPDPGLRDAERGGEVGTVGDRDDSPGGFNPAPRPDSTQDELDYRGNIGAPSPRPFTELNALLEDKPGTTVGRRVDLNDVDVASAQPGSFWIHDGNARVEVVAPDVQTVRAGQSVDVTGTIESDGADGIRIRAERVTAR